MIRGLRIEVSGVFGFRDSGSRVSGCGFGV